MKKIFLILIVAICHSMAFSQNLNPYKVFGYKTKYEYARTKKEDGLYLTNKEYSSKVKAILISLNTKQVFILDEKDSITQISNIPENVLTRFLSIDPLTKKYPELTPYQFASNTPIQGIDLDGLELYLTTKGELLGSFGKSTQIRVVTDATIQNQIKADAATAKKDYPANYDSYHTSLTTLNTSINMLNSAEASTTAQGFAAVVTHKNQVINGTTGAARLEVDKKTGQTFMITPENYPTITPPKDPTDNQNTTIIHSHPVHSFAYDYSTRSFNILPYGSDIRTSPLLGATSTGQAYNALVPLSPSPADVINTDNSKGYNWILIGNINPINYNSANGQLSPGTTGAIFYKGNISTESFRLNKQELNDLNENATLQVAAKMFSNYLNRPQ